MDKDKFRENNNYTYQLKMSKEDINKIPVFGKEKLKECKDKGYFILTTHL